jgi:hypothetical protein
MLLTHVSYVVVHTLNILKPAVCTMRSHCLLITRYALNNSGPYAGPLCVLCCVYTCTHTLLYEVLLRYHKSYHQ